MGCHSIIGVEIDKILFQEAVRNIGNINQFRRKLVSSQCQILNQDVLYADIYDRGTSFFLFCPFDFASFCIFFHNLETSWLRCCREITIFLVGKINYVEQYIALNPEAFVNFIAVVEQHVAPPIVVLRIDKAKTK